MKRGILFIGLLLVACGPLGSVALESSTGKAEKDVEIEPIDPYDYLTAQQVDELIALTYQAVADATYDDPQGEYDYPDLESFSYSWTALLLKQDPQAARGTLLVERATVKTRGDFTSFDPCVADPESDDYSEHESADLECLTELSLQAGAWQVTANHCDVDRRCGE